MNTASDADTRRVRLLSRAQHRQAAATHSGPSPLDAASPDCGQASTTPPATMATMPQTMRRSAFSSNTSQAINAVSTASRLSSSEAVAPLVETRPTISTTGPITPPNRMAPSSHGHSERCRPDGFQPPSRATRNRLKPRPLPRYSSPANSTGGRSPTSSLASGVLAPNKAAAPNA